MRSIFFPLQRKYVPCNFDPVSFSPVCSGPSGSHLLHVESFVSAPVFFLCTACCCLAPAPSNSPHSVSMSCSLPPTTLNQPIVQRVLFDGTGTAFSKGYSNTKKQRAETLNKANVFFIYENNTTVAFAA